MSSGNRAIDRMIAHYNKHKQPTGSINTGPFRTPGDIGPFRTPGEPVQPRKQRLWKRVCDHMVFKAFLLTLLIIALFSGMVALDHFSPPMPSCVESIQRVDGHHQLQECQKVFDNAEHTLYHLEYVNIYPSHTE